MPEPKDDDPAALDALVADNEAWETKILCQQKYVMKRHVASVFEELGLLQEPEQEHDE